MKQVFTIHSFVDEKEPLKILDLKQKPSKENAELSVGPQTLARESKLSPRPGRRPDTIRRKFQKDPTASAKKVGRIRNSSHIMVTCYLNKDFCTKCFPCPP
jgi:hypothetical protein